MGRFCAPFSPYPRNRSRPTCFSCLRPTSHCVCDLVAPFEAHTNILVMQHPHEWRKYYSSTKLVFRAIKNSRYVRGVVFDESQIAHATRGQRVHLLYPSTDARDCEAVPLTTDDTVIVIDGTWDEAQKILFRNPFLRSFPALSFSRPLRSQYRIRKQPKAHCLSTLESVGHLLMLNAAAQGMHHKIAAYRSLFEGFEKMINQQLQYWPRIPKAEVA